MPTWAPTGSGPRRTASPRSPQNSACASSPSISRATRCWCPAGDGARSAGRCHRSHRCRSRSSASCSCGSTGSAGGCRSNSRGSRLLITDWDAQTVDTFARRHLRTAGGRLFLNLATELVFGAEPDELSLLYFLFYLQSGGGLDSLTEFEGGAQQDHFVGGSQQLCDRLAESIERSGAAGKRGRGGRAGRRRDPAAHRGRLRDPGAPRDRGRLPAHSRAGGTGRGRCRPTGTCSRSACRWAPT